MAELGLGLLSPTHKGKHHTSSIQAPALAQCPLAARSYPTQQTEAEEGTDSDRLPGLLWRVNKEPLPLRVLAPSLITVVMWMPVPIGQMDGKVMETTQLTGDSTQRQG